MMSKNKFDDFPVVDTPRYAHVMYCDDARIEASNKPFYIGVYANDMFAVDFPFVLNKLVVVIEVSTPSERPLESLAFVIKLGDREILTQEIPDEQLSMMKSAAQKGLDEYKEWVSKHDPDIDRQPIQVVSVELQLNGLEIEGEGSLLVNIYADGERLRTRSLRIRKVTQP